MFFIQLMKLFYLLENNFRVTTTKGAVYWTHKAYSELQGKGMKFEEVKDADETQLFLRKVA